MSMKRIALFIPCYVNDFYPQAAISTLEVLESLGYEVEYPQNQSCCGQPFFNNALLKEARAFAKRFIDTFATYDYIVAPSSSFIATVRERYEDILHDRRYRELKGKVYELCEFLHDVVGLENLNFSSGYRGRVGLHKSCHALRALKLASPSELMTPHFDKIKAVLSRVEGLQIIEASSDECCGFGGTFSLQEHEISARMGLDRIDEHLANGVDLIASVDMSCLMHLEGLARRKKIALSFVHVSQLISGRVF